MTRLFAHLEPIQVTADPNSVPVGIYWGERWHTVAQVCNRWRVTSSWWETAAFAHREYIKLVTADGLLCTVYRDLVHDAWYMDRIYD
jgi:hypothetical protein